MQTTLGSEGQVLIPPVDPGCTGFGAGHTGDAFGQFTGGGRGEKNAAR